MGRIVVLGSDRMDGEVLYLGGVFANERESNM